MNDDEELLKKIATGDAQAFESLMKKHQRIVYGLSKRILGAHMLAEENAQETWIRVVKAAGSFQPRASVLSWILKICKNHALNILQKRGWEENLEDEQLQQIEMPQEELVTQLEKAQTLQLLKQAVAQLPDRQRVALVLWMQEEKSYSELAQELNLNTNAVKVLLFRAKQNVQKYLQQKGEVS